MIIVEEDILASSTKPRISTGEETSQKSGISDERSFSPNRILDVPNGDPGKILPANFSPPPSPPVTPADQIMTTPKRRTSLSTSNPDFKSPSPPKGLPELPDPPSSEEADSDRTPPLRTPTFGNKYVDTKTPRPPGGWATPFTTPAPPERAVPLLVNSDLGTFQTELCTPPASLSRATSLLLKTPAPPGAWLPTPANSKKLQKVRFDKEDSSGSQIIKEASPDKSGQSSVNDGSHMGQKGSDAPGTERKEVSSPRTPRRISTIRVVDAFGKQIVDVPDGQQSHADLGHELQNINHEKSDSSLGTNKTRIRVVNNMDMSVEGPREPDNADESSAQENLSSYIEELEGKKLERKQALELLQKTIADLKNDFTRTDMCVFHSI